MALGLASLYGWPAVEIGCPSLVPTVVRPSAAWPGKPVVGQPRRWIGRELSLQLVPRVPSPAWPVAEASCPRFAPPVVLAIAPGLAGPWLARRGDCLSEGCPPPVSLGASLLGEPIVGQARKSVGRGLDPIWNRIKTFLKAADDSPTKHSPYSRGWGVPPVPHVPPRMAPGLSSLYGRPAAELCSSKVASLVVPPSVIPAWWPHGGPAAEDGCPNVVPSVVPLCCTSSGRPAAEVACSRVILPCSCATIRHIPSDLRA